MTEVEHVPVGDISKETDVRVVNLVKKIDQNKILGDRSHEAEEKAINILGGLSGGCAYKSVQEMIDTVKDSEKTEVQRKNASDSLMLLGRAMCYVGEGEGRFLAMGGRLGVNLPRCLKGIEKYVLDDLLVSGEGDGLGRDIVEKLVKLEEVNRGVSLAPNANDSNKVKEIINIIHYLDDEYKKLNPSSDDAEKVETIMHILDLQLAKKTTGGSGGEFVPSSADDVESGARWELSTKFAAQAMKEMAYMHWPDYTPPQWFKDLDPKQIGSKESVGDIKARIECMVALSTGANHLMNNADLEKIRANPVFFKFDNEKFSLLFNDDFKLLYSKLLHDLCDNPEDALDENGRPCLRYKEVYDSEQGRLVIDPEVLRKLANIRDYKEELVSFIAKQNGRENPNWMDRMNGYSVWNMFYMFGDASLADRLRQLPAYTGVMQDQVRSLNPKNKFDKKMRIQSGGKLFKDLYGSEWYGGPVATYVQTVMAMEQDLGHSIDGKKGRDKNGKKKKTLQENIADGTFPLFDNKLCYGLLDFTSAGRDIFNKEGKKLIFNEETGEGDETLTTMLWKYGYEKKGDEWKLIDEKEERKDFSFGHRQVDFLNEYRDQLEAASFIYDCIMGKKKDATKDMDEFVRTLRKNIGMVDDLEINGQKRVYGYTRRPDLWASILLGVYGVDMSRLSSSHIRLKNDKVKTSDGSMVTPAYNLVVYDLLVDEMKLSNKDTNLNEVFRYLGVKLKDGEKPDSLRASIKETISYNKESKHSRKVSGKHKKEFNYDVLSVDILTIKKEFERVDKNRITDAHAKVVYNDLDRAIKSNNLYAASRLLGLLKKINRD